MKTLRPSLDEFRRELGSLADGRSDEEISRLQDQVEWFARFAVEQALDARATRPDLRLLKSA